MRYNEQILHIYIPCIINFFPAAFLYEDDDGYYLIRTDFLAELWRPTNAADVNSLTHAQKSASDKMGHQCDDLFHQADDMGGMILY